MRIGSLNIGPRKRLGIVIAVALLGFSAYLVERYELSWSLWAVLALGVFTMLGFGLVLAEMRRQRWALYDVAARVGETNSHLGRVDSAIERGNADSLLRWEYVATGLHEVRDTFVLYRIIGNDLPPRHAEGQSLANLRFILENESDFPGVTKRWVINRISDPDIEKQIMSLLDEHAVGYLHIPFELSEYRKVGWRLADFGTPGYTYSPELASLPKEIREQVRDHVYHDKNLYVMNNNGARNAALREGRELAKWVLPWDGNCFLTDSAWEHLEEEIKRRPYLKYFAVPMARIIDNQMLLDADFEPVASEEPQLVFRRDAREMFDEDARYGRRPKVELFYRLGIPGIWDNWYFHSWESPRPPVGPDAGAVGQASWVARLSSGREELEADIKNRGRKRMSAIRLSIDSIDVSIADDALGRNPFIFWDEATLQEQRHGWSDDQSPSLSIVEALIGRARACLGSPVYSVVDKTTLPPSGDPHDYWHPAPYWWPNPESPDGLPYVVRDGERVPGTLLWEPGSEQYDRSSIQSMIDETTVSALAGYFTDDSRFYQRARDLVVAWFVAPETRMNPHLEYAQVIMGHNSNRGSNWGIIETKDLHYLVDAIRLLEVKGQIGNGDSLRVREWFSEFAEWLVHSEQGTMERQATNNHGTWYDVQLGAIDAYLGNTRRLLKTIRRSHDRVAQQFSADGRQPEELTRTTSQHYCHYNLQGWIALGTLASRAGQDLFGFQDVRGPSIRGAVQWLLDRTNEPWNYPQIDVFDEERTRALAAQAVAWMDGIDDRGLAGEPAAVNQEFSVHYGIRPFWWIGSRSASLARRPWDA